MKVFLSWSGDRSRAVAESLYRWLPSVIQTVHPWFSAEDIGKGSVWNSDLNAELAAHSFAIVCLTPENLSAPWLLFEAGALSKALTSAAICPLLVGVAPTDVQGPLAQFQSARAEKVDIRKLVGSINARLAENRLSEPLQDEAFEAFWPRLEKTLLTILNTQGAKVAATRTMPDMLVEVVDRLRKVERSLSEHRALVEESDDDDQEDESGENGYSGRRSPYGGPSPSPYGSSAPRSAYGTTGGRSQYGSGGRSPYGGGAASNSPQKSAPQSEPSNGPTAPTKPTPTKK